MGTEDSKLVRCFRILTAYHATFHRGHVVGKKEGEATPYAKIAHFGTVPLCSQGFTTVFDDKQVVLSCQGENIVHETGIAHQVHNENGPGQRCDLPGHV